VETNYRVIRDDGRASHLNAVAGRILSQFPPDQARAEFLKWRAAVTSYPDLARL
jgi:hypothetical protein